MSETAAGDAEGADGAHWAVAAPPDAAAVSPPNPAASSTAGRSHSLGALGGGLSTGLKKTGVLSSRGAGPSAGGPLLQRLLASPVAAGLLSALLSALVVGLAMGLARAARSPPAPPPSPPPALELPPEPSDTARPLWSYEVVLVGPRRMSPHPGAPYATPPLARCSYPPAGSAPRGGSRPWRCRWRRRWCQGRRGGRSSPPRWSTALATTRCCRGRARTRAFLCAPRAHPACDKECPITNFHTPYLQRHLGRFILLSISFRWMFTTAAARAGLTLLKGPLGRWYE